MTYNYLEYTKFILKLKYFILFNQIKKNKWETTIWSKTIYWNISSSLLNFTQSVECTNKNKKAGSSHGSKLHEVNYLCHSIIGWSIIDGDCYCSYLYPSYSSCNIVIARLDFMCLFRDSNIGISKLQCSVGYMYICRIKFILSCIHIHVHVVTIIE